LKFFGSLDTSASGLTAQRLRLDVIADNLANVNTTRGKGDAPYRKKSVVLAERSQLTSFAWLMNRLPFAGTGAGVRAIAVVEEKSPGKRKYEPGHPDADEEGFVEYPNVDPVIEMVDMISASRAYEANVTAINTFKRMVQKALEIGRG